MRQQATNELRPHQILTPEAFSELLRSAAQQTGMHLLNYEDGQRDATCSTDANTWNAAATVSVYSRYSDGVTVSDQAFETRDKVVVFITWSSTGRTIAESLLQVAAYQRAIQFAAIVEASTAGKFFVRRCEK